MAPAKTPPSADPSPRSLGPFRRAGLRGLGGVLPPLLTVVIFLWVGSTVARYVLTPLEGATRYVLVEYLSDIRTAADFAPKVPTEDAITDAEGRLYHRTPDGLFVPSTVYDEVEKRLGGKEADPTTARGWYRRYVDEVWLVPWIVVPIFLSVFLLLLYTIGKFLAAGIGRFFYGQFESLITRVPLVSNVYSSVKQVTDFLFSENELDITRVVAVEYPRKGIWTVAFVTGESLLDIESAANESVMTVLIPTSPMPFTGFTITVKKSETVDLNLTIDQAFQFVVSCGVVVPTHQITQAVAERDRRLAAGEPPDLSASGLANSLRPSSDSVSSNGSGHDSSDAGEPAKSVKDGDESSA
ncbi:MAG: DUF502 domain-containing protein [Planctomycetota bacterium]